MQEILLDTHDHLSVKRTPLISTTRWICELDLFRFHLYGLELDAGWARFRSSNVDEFTPMGDHTSQQFEWSRSSAHWKDVSRKRDHRGIKNISSSFAQMIAKELPADISDLNPRTGWFLPEVNVWSCLNTQKNMNARFCQFPWHERAITACGKDKWNAKAFICASLNLPWRDPECSQFVSWKSFRRTGHWPKFTFILP